ncbi:MAG: ubiquinone biosynthesis protein UbiE [Clostridiales bacterium]|nr:ubiquinone biosynthesis protein UbiE [Clostridiales bacterium]
METEAFISGFCKRQNQTRTVYCEYEAAEDGSRRLLDSDCDYGSCEHSHNCTLMAQAKEQGGATGHTGAVHSVAGR